MHIHIICVCTRTYTNKVYVHIIHRNRPKELMNARHAQVSTPSQNEAFPWICKESRFKHSNHKTESLFPTAYTSLHIECTCTGTCVAECMRYGEEKYFTSHSMYTRTFCSILTSFRLYASRTVSIPYAIAFR